MTMELQMPHDIGRVSWVSLTIWNRGSTAPPVGQTVAFYFFLQFFYLLKKISPPQFVPRIIMCSASPISVELNLNDINVIKLLLRCMLMMLFFFRCVGDLAYWLARPRFLHSRRSGPLWLCVLNSQQYRRGISSFLGSIGLFQPHSPAAFNHLTPSCDIEGNPRTEPCLAATQLDFWTKKWEKWKRKMSLELRFCLSCLLCT